LTKNEELLLMTPPQVLNWRQHTPNPAAHVPEADPERWTHSAMV
jgi:hypothetical protein